MVNAPRSRVVWRGSECAIVVARMDQMFGFLDVVREVALLGKTRSPSREQYPLSSRLKRGTSEMEGSRPDIPRAEIPRLRSQAHSARDDARDEQTPCAREDKERLTFR